MSKETDSETLREIRELKEAVNTLNDKLTAFIRFQMVTWSNIQIGTKRPEKVEKAYENLKKAVNL